MFMSSVGIPAVQLLVDLDVEGMPAHTGCASYAPAVTVTLPGPMAHGSWSHLLGDDRMLVAQHSGPAVLAGAGGQGAAGLPAVVVSILWVQNKGKGE
jgi:hypothetical protein